MQPKLKDCVHNLFTCLFKIFCGINSLAQCIFKINLFIYLWLLWVFVAVRGLSLVVMSRGYSLLQCVGFTLRRLLLLQSTGSRRTGFSSCGTQAQQLWLVGSREQAQQLWRTGLVALQHVGSSWTRDRTRIPCSGRQLLNHCHQGSPTQCIFKVHMKVRVAMQLKLGVSSHHHLWESVKWVPGFNPRTTSHQLWSSYLIHSVSEFPFL